MSPLHARGSPKEGEQNQKSKPTLGVTMMPLGAPSITKYGSLVRPDAQIVALRLRLPLRVAKNDVPVTSTQQDGSISKTLKHELHQKFVRTKQKVPSAKIWAPVHRNVVLEACLVAANMLWHTIFPCLLHHLFELQEAGGCTILMQTENHSGKCTFVGAKEEVDAFCVCGTCGKMRGMRR